jgi:hypothetical protein
MVKITPPPSARYDPEAEPQAAATTKTNDTVVGDDGGLTFIRGEAKPQ